MNLVPTLFYAFCGGDQHRIDAQPVVVVVSHVQAPRHFLVVAPRAVCLPLVARGIQDVVAPAKANLSPLALQ